MNADRLADIFTLMERLDRHGSREPSLCHVAVELTGLDGAGVSLTPSPDVMTILCSHGPAARLLLGAEMTLGEGPALHASRTGASVVESDLRHPSRPLWAPYASEALALGVRAAFAFPVRIGAIRFGALSLFRGTPGELSDDTTSDSQIMASVVARAVLSMEAGAPPDDLLSELRGPFGLDFRVHQAAGMLAVQASMPVRDALVTLRAHSYANGIELTTLAKNVIARRASIDQKTGAWIDTGAKPQ
ncbi:MAG TPA: GAF domain-containing protein [Acidimicrobiales bacterium]|nr:MAG: hypothetical protein B7Z69_01345 [Actinobacteria bacterium 21-73-9]HQU25875.1 GAF domain-containing protein [Acidimicrobiales bacterium]